jgi:hypothetical protein
VFETRRFTIAEFKRIGRLVDGASINDAVIAVCGGALRRYLLEHEELPSPGLIALAPVPVHNATDAGVEPDPEVLRVPLGRRSGTPCAACVPFATSRRASMGSSA